MDKANRDQRPLLGVSLALLLAIHLLGCGTGANAIGAQDARVVAELTRQAEQWDKDIVRKDRSAIAANMADDFRQIRSDGSIVDKATFLRDITSPDLVIDPYTVEDFSVRVYGDTALLCGRTQMTGRYAGEAFESHYRYIDIYVRRDGRWFVCSVQTTPIRGQ